MKRFMASIIVGLLVLTLPQLEAGQKLRYKFEKGKTYRYEIHADNAMTGQMAGQEFKADSKTTLTVMLTLDTVHPDGTMELIATLEGLQSKVDLPAMGVRDSTIDFKEMNGKRVRITMSDRGKTTDVSAIDTMPRNRMLGMMGGQPTEMFRRLIPELPDQEVNLKGTWSRTSAETTQTGTMTVISKPNIQYTVAASEDHNGYQCWKIVYSGSTTTEGTGTSRGMDVTIDGTMKTGGTIFVAPAEGMLVDFDSQADIDQTQTFSGPQAGAQSLQMKIKSSSTLLK